MTFVWGNRQMNSSNKARLAVAAVGLAAAVLAASPQARNTINDLLNPGTSMAKVNPVKATKADGNIFVEYNGNVFKVEYERPEEGRGVDQLVHKLNPNYNNAQIANGGELASKLIAAKDKLNKLQEGEVIELNAEYLRPPALSFTSSYPIPKQVTARNLNEVLTPYK